MDFNKSSLLMNNSKLSDPGLFEYLIGTFYGFISLLTIVFNSFALVVLRRWRHEFEDVSRMLFRSLAIVNLASGICVGVNEGMLFHLDRGHASEISCWFIPSVGTFMLFSSIYHVALMNLQRYLAICYPFRYMRLATTKRLAILYCLMYFIFIGISAGALPVPKLPFNEIVRSWCRHRTIIYTHLDGASLGIDINIFFAIFGIIYVIPFILLTYINIRLLVIARRATRQRYLTPAQNNEETTNVTQRTTGLKGLRTVFIITGLFYLSLIPLFVFICGMVFATSLGIQIHGALYFVANAVLICSCWWNVPVYMSTSVKVRQRARDLWARLKFCKAA